jgi:hypothetical protein
MACGAFFADLDSARQEISVLGVEFVLLKLLDSDWNLLSKTVCSEVFRCQKKTIARNAKAQGQSVPTLPLSFAVNAVEAERANQNPK